MKIINKTRYAILGVLIERAASGYEIKSFMKRSTMYFWRESDSTIYPMLKTLTREGKVLSQTVYVGKKRKEIFSITESGRSEFKSWFESPTGSETPRNEFLLKLFFVTDQKEMIRLFQERLEKIKITYEEYKKIEQRLESLADSSLKITRLKALRYGLSLIEAEMEWLNEKK